MADAAESSFDCESIHEFMKSPQENNFQLNNSKVVCRSCETATVYYENYPIESELWADAPIARSQRFD